MSEGKFSKLFKYVEDFRAEMNQKFEQTASQTALDSLTNMIDAFLKRLEEVSLENKCVIANLNGYWNGPRKLSEKTGIPLENL